MVRDVDIQMAKKEEIISYEYYLNGSVKVTVGIGDTGADGQFILDPDYSEQSYLIVGEDFDSLMAANGDKPQGRFRLEDLWLSVDGRRSAIKAEKVKLEELNQQLSTNKDEPKV